MGNTPSGLLQSLSDSERWELLGLAVYRWNTTFPFAGPTVDSRGHAIDTALASLARRGLAKRAPRLQARLFRSDRTILDDVNLALRHAYYRKWDITPAGQAAIDAAITADIPDAWTADPDEAHLWATLTNLR